MSYLIKKKNPQQTISFVNVNVKTVKFPDRYHRSTGGFS